MAEEHRGETWLNAGEVAERFGVTVDAVHRRMHEGLLPHKSIGAEGEALPHFHPDDLADGFPYPELEGVEAGKTFTDQPPRYEWLHESGSALVATKVVRVGQAPMTGSLNATSIGGNLPRDRWRVLGPGDLVAADESQGLDEALSTGAIVRLPVNRGLIYELLATTQRANS